MTDIDLGASLIVRNFRSSGGKRRLVREDKRGFPSSPGIDLDGALACVCPYGGVTSAPMLAATLDACGLVPNGALVAAIDVLPADADDHDPARTDAGPIRGHIGIGPIRGHIGMFAADGTPWDGVFEHVPVGHAGNATPPVRVPAIDLGEGYPEWARWQRSPALPECAVPVLDADTRRMRYIAKRSREDAAAVACSDAMARLRRRAKVLGMGDDEAIAFFTYGRLTVGDVCLGREPRTESWRLDVVLPTLRLAYGDAVMPDPDEPHYRSALALRQIMDEWMRRREAFRVSVGHPDGERGAYMDAGLAEAVRDGMGMESFVEERLGA